MRCIVRVLTHEDEDGDGGDDDNDDNEEDISMLLFFDGSPHWIEWHWLMVCGTAVRYNMIMIQQYKVWDAAS